MKRILKVSLGILVIVISYLLFALLPEIGRTYLDNGRELYLKNGKLYYQFYWYRECEREIEGVSDPWNFKIITGSMHNGWYATDNINNYQFWQTCINLHWEKCGCWFSISNTEKI